MGKENDQTYYVVLGKRPQDNSWKGVVERSFSMALDDGHAKIFWSGRAVGRPVPIRVDLDGERDANRHRDQFVENHPDMEFTVFRTDDPDLPVVIDWERREWGLQPADTLSGVRDKFLARNAPFENR